MKKKVYPFIIFSLCFLKGPWACVYQKTGDQLTQKTQGFPQKGGASTGEVEAKNPPQPKSPPSQPPQENSLSEPNPREKYASLIKESTISHEIITGMHAKDIVEYFKGDHPQIKRKEKDETDRIKSFKTSERMQMIQEYREDESLGYEDTPPYDKHLDPLQWIDGQKAQEAQEEKEKKKRRKQMEDYEKEILKNKKGPSKEDFLKHLSSGDEEEAYKKGYVNREIDGENFSEILSRAEENKLERSILNKQGLTLPSKRESIVRKEKQGQPEKKGEACCWTFNQNKKETKGQKAKQKNSVFDVKREKIDKTSYSPNVLGLLLGVIPKTKKGETFDAMDASYAMDDVETIRGSIEGHDRERYLPLPRRTEPAPTTFKINDQETSNDMDLYMDSLRIPSGRDVSKEGSMDEASSFRLPEFQEKDILYRDKSGSLSSSGILQKLQNLLVSDPDLELQGMYKFQGAPREENRVEGKDLTPFLKTQKTQVFPPNLIQASGQAHFNRASLSDVVENYFQ